MKISELNNIDNAGPASAKRIAAAVTFSIAFAYIESAVVVYLRMIFHPNGFYFPLMPGINQLWKQAIFTEVGREAATIIVILTAAVLFGNNRRQRIAYFMIIFSVWDIFYYIWLKILINWPASIMDWDILFLIPMIWASPVLAPVLISFIIFLFSLIIFATDRRGLTVRLSVLDKLVLASAGIVSVVSFCAAGLHISNDDYKSHFDWTIFTAAVCAAVLIMMKNAYKLAKADSYLPGPLDGPGSEDLR